MRQILGRLRPHVKVEIEDGGSPLSTLLSPFDEPEIGRPGDSDRQRTLIDSKRLLPQRT
jgi:hypothetical protein